MTDKQNDAGTTPGAGKRPNILWIIADQLRADHVGFGGNPIVRTPHLDALAARATVFDRAWVANPICMPNRCSMLTGRMPSAHGVVFNDRSLAWNANTFARELSRAGYRTALIGKSHIQHGLSRNVVRAQRQAPTLANPYPDGWDSLENPELYLEGSPSIPDFYGFQHVEFAIGHADAVAGHHYQWAVQRGADPQLLHTEWGPGSPARARYAPWWQVYQPVLPEEFHSTTFVTEQTIAWLEQRRAQSGGNPAPEPFFLQCSFPDPHHPFAPPGRWWDAYRPADMPEPATFDDPLTDAPAHLRVIRALKPSKNPVQMFGPSRELVRHAMAAEFGLIEMMDQGIGRILTALERLGLADDTIVVFTSDHGEMFGDHGLMLKATMHYQQCLRVPLLIARPGGAAARTRALASSLDLAQTFLDLAGAAPFADMQGTSLVPVLHDPSGSVRDHAFVEEDFPLAQHGSPLPLRTRTLVTDRYRYSRYSSGDVELYDLEADPAELCNLANDPGYRSVRADVTEQLLDAMTRVSPLAMLG
jgi:arylsulfatase A-like enzyme